MAHNFKRVYISKNLEMVEEFRSGSVGGKFYGPESSRKDFLEVINDWNRLALLMAKEPGKVEYLYIAL